MAQPGDTDDMLRRQKAVLPRGWFPDVPPVLDGVLTGFATVAAHIAALIAYGRLQTRLSTATDGWLDLLAYDFFGLRFKRALNESDDAWRARIKAEILRPRATRASIIQALTTLTGRAPRFFEPANVLDTGGLGDGSQASPPWCGMAWNVCGRWGSMNYPGQAFITAYRPNGQGVPFVSGYNEAAGGYGAGSIEYVGVKQITGPISDAQIYATADDTKAAGTLMWTDIESTDNEFFVDSARVDQAKVF